MIASYGYARVYFEIPQAYGGGCVCPHLGGGKGFGVPFDGRAVFGNSAPAEAVIRADVGSLLKCRLLALANSLVRFSVRALGGWVALERRAAVRAFLSLVLVPGVARKTLTTNHLA
jgi:hypothetical protein